MVRQAEAAVQAGDRYLYVPTPKQAEFTGHPAKYILFGGAAGPGKSHAARWALYRKCLTIRNFEALLLRETFPELERTHLRRMAVEAELIGAEFLETKRQMRFPQTGSLIECGHMDDEAAVRKYLSSEYDCIVPEEGSSYHPQPLLELFTRARTSKPQVKAAGGAKVWVVSNPGGRAAMLLLDFFIDHQPDFDVYPALVADYDPNQWVYIPGSLDDNPYIDEGYQRALAVLPKWRYEQLRHGNWRVFSGQFFDTWAESRDAKPWHVQTIGIPKGVEWFGSLDWGRASPGCMLWWACLEDGSYHIRHEWKFQGMSAEEVGPIIKRMTKEHGIKKLRYIAADPSIWAKKGEGKGESIGETLSRCGLPVRKSDNDRLSGWSRVVSLLRDRGDHSPWLTMHPDCKYLRRTIPAQVSDKTDPEDVDTSGDDHGADALRYGAMSRPRPTEFAEIKKPYPEGSWGWHVEHYHKKPSPGVLA